MPTPPTPPTPTTGRPPLRLRFSGDNVSPDDEGHPLFFAPTCPNLRHDPRAGFRPDTFPLVSVVAGLISGQDDGRAASAAKSEDFHLSLSLSSFELLFVFARLRQSRDAALVRRSFRE